MAHLRKLRWLCDTVHSVSVSEHLCWNAVDGIYINDLLPFPYTHDALDYVVARVQRVQDALGRHILIDGCMVDTHDRPICDEVWQLYEMSLQYLNR